MTNLLLKEAMHRLQKEPIVDRCAFRHKHIEVWFKTNIKENWYLHKRKKSELANSYLIPNHWTSMFDKSLHIRHEFQFFPEDLDYELMNKFITIRRSDYEKATFYERRIGLHNFINQFVSQIGSELRYPQVKLLEDIKLGAEFDVQKYKSGRTIMTYNSRAGKYKQYCRMTVEHFSKWMTADLKSALSDPSRVYYMIKMMLRKKNNITINMLIRYLRRRYKIGPKFIDPGFYRTIMKTLNLEGVTVADPNPSFGSKAVACAYEDCQYYFNETTTNIKGIMDLMGGSALPIDDGRVFDIVFLDSADHDNTFVHDLELAQKMLESWKNRADLRIILVHKSIERSLPKADQKIPITHRPLAERNIDYALCYW